MHIKRRRKPMSIGTKTLLSHISLAIAIIVLACALSYALSYQYVRRTRITDLVIKAKRIAYSAKTTRDGDFRHRRRLVQTFEGLTDAKVFFLDADTETVRMSQTPYDEQEDEDDLQWVEVLDSIDRQFADRILAGETVTAQQRFEFAQDVLLLAGTPIYDDTGTLRGGVILAQPVKELRILSRGILLIIAIVIGVSLLLAVFISMHQSHMLVLPLKRITSAARQMEDGAYEQRISGLPDNEIGDLGRALNSMSGRLSDVIRNLRKERDKLELVMSGIGEGLIAVDIHWHIVHVNQAYLELTEQDRAEAILSDSEAPLQPLREALERCIQSAEPCKAEWTNPSGRALSATVSPLLDENGMMLGAVCLLRDVSEAQRMEQLRRDYVANISHELRTPLTGIRGLVEPLIDGCIETEQERLDCYRVILKETVRLQKLVGEMLDMSRLQDGRMSVDLEPMELPGIMAAAVHSMQQIADDAGVELRTVTDDTPLACLGNEARITQVLIILMDNAISFTPRGGTVTVFARDGGDHVNVGVRDTGCGIEPKDLPLIWERFYKADRSRMRTTGTGLGLSIAKLVVELMGGEIGVTSKPGQGAEFTFTLKKP